MVSEKGTAWVAPMAVCEARPRHGLRHHRSPNTFGPISESDGYASRNFGPRLPTRGQQIERNKSCQQLASHYSRDRVSVNR